MEASLRYSRPCGACSCSAARARQLSRLADSLCRQSRHARDTRCRQLLSTPNGSSGSQKNEDDPPARVCHQYPRLSFVKRVEVVWLRTSHDLLYAAKLRGAAGDNSSGQDEQPPAARLFAGGISIQASSTHHTVTNSMPQRNVGIRVSTPEAAFDRRREYPGAPGGEA
ncbi:hypothetical protein BKA80DRAFT_132765 [Phyllosticta citrichinensis]